MIWFVPRFVTTLIVTPDVCCSRSEPPVATSTSWNVEKSKNVFVPPFWRANGLP
ncbi:MAG: hypothetical protein ACM3NW_06105 [Syntrophomonadaceae bacterium]